MDRRLHSLSPKPEFAVRSCLVFDREQLPSQTLKVAEGLESGFCLQRRSGLEKPTQTEEYGCGEGSYRRGRGSGKSKPSFAADDGERARTDVDLRDLLRVRGDGVLALATDVPGIADADGVLSRPSHSH